MRSLPVLFASLALSSLASTSLAVDFATEIAPIFAANCAGCHGEEKGLGRLRLHSSEAIEQGMKDHSDLLIAKDPDKSELYARLVLPKDDSKRMPKGADPLSEKDINLIKQWIAEGGTLVTAEAPAAEAPMEEAAPVKKDVPVRPKLEAASPEAMQAVEATGALVIPLYSGSNELRVSFPSSREQVTDETVAALVPLAGQIVELDLSGTKITDVCGESLKQLVNLDTLHLEKTNVGDATVSSLTEMPYLAYLNLHSTKVTDASLEALKSVAALEKLYLWQTAASYEAAKALEKHTPGLEVNLGWDHPGVVRERLTEELARVEADSAAAAKALEDAKKAMEAAEAEQKASADRLGEIKKQLEELNKPAAEAKPAEGEQKEA
jgi:mono/diheme cytochrome c family protein